MLFDVFLNGVLCGLICGTRVSSVISSFLLFFFFSTFQIFISYTHTTGPCPLFWLVPTRWGMTLENGLRPPVTKKGRQAFETISTAEDKSSP